MKVSKIIAKLHKWPHTFLPIYHLQFLNLLKLSLFLGCTLISVMASSISSVEDRNTPEYLNFFGQPISKRREDLLLLGKKMVLLHAHKLGVQCTDCQCGAPWKQWSYCSGMVPPLSEVCACLGRTPARNRLPLPEYFVQATAGHLLPQVQPESTQGLSQRIVLSREIACARAPWASQLLVSDICPSFSGLKTTMCTPGWQAKRKFPALFP